jgi:hypothetical protein
MNAIMNDDHYPLSHAVERLVAEHGVHAVIAAVMLRLFRRRPAAGGARGGAAIGPLSDHLRRDIGLPPVDVDHPLIPVPPFPPRF